MRRYLANCFFAALILSATSGGVKAQAVSDESIDKVSMPERHFRFMLLNGLNNLQTMAMAAYNLGIDGRCTIMKPVFEATYVKYLPEWVANLRAAYREHVPSEILTEASTAGISHAVELIDPFKEKIGTQMQTESQDLLQKALLEIVTPVGTAASEINSKSIDGQARMSELRAAMEAKTLNCGLEEPLTAAAVEAGEQ